MLGQKLEDTACGPTHAILKAHPDLHRNYPQALTASVQKHVEQIEVEREP